MIERKCVVLSPDSAISKRSEYSKDVIVFDEENLLWSFVGKVVLIKNAGFHVQAKLLWFEGPTGNGQNHKPMTLLIQGPDGQRQILRGWESVGTPDDNVLHAHGWR